MLAVDLLHEIKLGVWRTLFTHLIRMLYVVPHGPELVAKLDERFRQVPAFGTTIRRFLGNPSEMKKLAARNFEDLLQCAIPVFEGLFEGEHDERLLKLLYRLAEWHTLAKLRMHSDTTLEWLETITKEVGMMMRAFRDKTASQFDTLELPRERDARARRQAGAMSQQPDYQAQAPLATSSTNQASRKTRKLNLFTYKFHAMGDYVLFIRLFGTTDNYSTQIGELAHRMVKALYGLTNKRDATKQIAKRYNREKHLRQAKVNLQKAKKLKQLGKGKGLSVQILSRHTHHVGMEMSTVEEDMKISPDLHHFISENNNHPISLHSFLLDENREDPAKKDFWPKLQDHLLGRLLGRDFDGDSYGSFTNNERNSIDLYKKRFYAVKTMRINYTTYDVRRDQDVINPRTDHCAVMVYSADEDPKTHPYWYARVLGIFHADVVWMENGQVRIEHLEFLWVRWMGVEPRYRWGRKIGRLPKIGFIVESDAYAFGFLDPALVIRACHLIPDFVTGRTLELLNTQEVTAARPVGDTDDWGSFYVNIFVDRDMFMRHAGGGVGHVRSDARQVDKESFLNEQCDAGDEGDGSDSHASDSDDGSEDNVDEGDNVELDSGDDLGPEDGEDLYDDDHGYGSP
ncbi:hypothetical protein GGU11DRAFT_750655 [Lentinula aff. detonsa]|nr:hypothetical protein GGU11DRAFT_750655 [Lentinula aff. detonsa]